VENVVNFPDPTSRQSLTRDDPSAFAAPAQFGPFRVLHQIGVGALGPVFRTYEPERDRLVAVKVFRLDITPEQAQALADELSRSAEAGLFHPSIVEPIAAGVEGTVAYCAEEYVAAESLDVAMRHYAPAPIATALPFITQLAGAIDFARAAGVGHGAMHPRDIFVTPEEARVTGFGVVEALERVGLRAPVRRPYSPPERIAGKPWDTSADVFSLAAITFELLTGRRPAGLGTEIGTLTAGTPNTWMDALHAVLTRAMDADPAVRYQTALGFAAALEAAGRGELAAEPPRTIAPAAAPPAVAHGLQATGPSDSRTGGPADLRDDDIDAEREEDEAEDLLRAEEAAAAPGAAMFTDLDGDIAAEAEADRFVTDDFLLGAAGAASGVPEPPTVDTLRARNIGIDPAVDPRIALEDDEVTVDDARPPDVAPRDRLHETKADTHEASAAHAPSLGYTPAVEEEVAPARSAWAVTLLVILALAAGAGGGWFLRGRMAPGDGPASQAAATTGPAAANPAPAGREFSEQAVAPAAKPGAPASPPAASPGGTAVTTPPASTAKPAAAVTGTLIVRSTPSGAGVTVDGRWRGRTPLTIRQLPLRSYDVRVVQPGFEAATESVALTSGTPQRSLALRLQRSPRAAPRPAAPEPPDTATSSVYTGSLYVDSRPRGARVSIDGRAVGVTPLLVPDVRIGTHVVRLELPDHRIWSSPATVTAGQERRVTGSLERIQ
jgi:Protein kinase domain/PEGA domain